jgi:hypothetical protein
MTFIGMSCLIESACSQESVESELVEHSIARSLSARDPIKKTLASAVQALNDAYQMIDGRVAPAWVHHTPRLIPIVISIVGNE